MKTKISKVTGTLLLAGCLMLISVAGFGQAATTNKQEKRQDKQEAIMSQKIAFITQELQLTTDEAQKFWPIYNEYNAKKDDFTKVKREAEKNARLTGMDKLNDKQAEDLINGELQYEQQLLDLKKEYKDKFKPVIGVKKIVQLYLAEKKFNKFLLKELKGSGKATDRK
jgi:hypothetical protein